MPGVGWAATAPPLQLRWGGWVYGARTPPIDRQARQLGMLEVLWNIDSADALGADKTRIAANVAAGSRPGAIILMHENRGQTIVALRRSILPMLRRRHLQAVTVPELLTLRVRERARFVDR